MMDQSITLRHLSSNETRDNGSASGTPPLPNGRLLIKSIHSLGTVPGAYNASLRLSTYRAFELGNELNCIESIHIEVVEGGDSERSEVAILSLNEVDGLKNGVDYLLKLIAKASNHQGDYIEVVFSTKENFDLGFYVDSGKLQAFVKSERCTAFVPPSSLRLLSDMALGGAAYLGSAPVFQVDPRV
jgi:hypothetical protein